MLLGQRQVRVCTTDTYASYAMCMYGVCRVRVREREREREREMEHGRHLFAIRSPLSILPLFHRSRMRRSGVCLPLASQPALRIGRHALHSHSLPPAAAAQNEMPTLFPQSAKDQQKGGRLCRAWAWLGFFRIVRILGTYARKGPSWCYLPCHAPSRLVRLSVHPSVHLCRACWMQLSSIPVAYLEPLPPRPYSSLQDPGPLSSLYSGHLGSMRW
ncbi:hypothetical protein LY76DRAFT_121280 [Colletotrichum caudatum]|nr:hypothetical protein LY76DRAFT_121280 [Colletotrichum caudatum]